MHPTEPEYHSHEEFILRKGKLTKIRSYGVDPYPPKFSPHGKLATLHDDCENRDVGHSEDAAAGSSPESTVAGRLVLFRAMGKNAFGHIQDETGRLQIMFNRDATKVVGYDGSDLSHIKFIEKLLDLGDIIGVSGHLFRTMKGELTLFAKEVTLLCKSLLPLPDKHAGLADKELRYRKRWLDLISNPEVLDTFRKRSHLIHIIRRHLDEHQFTEVETPVLQSTYGGAAARPFMTHLNALDQDLFLRISLEIPLKKLITGGIERVFEIAKVFRNEGMDRDHNPEFTMLELYAAYWDYNDIMELMEEMCERIAIALHGTTDIPFKDGHLDFSRPWKRATVKEAILEHAGIDVDNLSTEELRTLVSEKTEADRHKWINASRGILITLLFEELVEHKLMQPQFIYDYPIESTPLCKPHRHPRLREEGFVERFEAYVAGHEIANAYSELNDPVLQRELLEKQAAAKEAGDIEANPLDEEFIEAICQGMPPCGGLGIGIDRLTMLFTTAPSIRDVLYFPAMRDAGGGET